MAFQAIRLKFVGGFDNRNFGGDVFSYSHPTDTINDITTSGYFDEAVESFATGDIMWVNIASGALDILRMTVVGGVVSSVVSIPIGKSLTFDSQSVSASEAISIATDVTLLTAAASTPTLAAGVDGQQKRITLVAQTGAAVIAVSGGGLTSITLTNVHDAVDLGFSSGWHILAVSGSPTLAGA